MAEGKRALVQQRNKAVLAVVGTDMVDPVRESPATSAALAVIRLGATTPGHTLHISPDGGQGGSLRTPDSYRELVASEYITLCRGFFELADLDWEQRDLPQEGKLSSTSAEGERLAVRVSVAPEVRGPRVAVRVTRPDSPVLRLGRLGLDPAQLATLGAVLERRRGLLLVAGPRTSGKTALLHAMMSSLAAPHVSIIAAEEVIERVVHGACHLECKPDRGLTYAHLTRAMRRQNADVCVIADLRDYETTELALQTALTGRLVLAAMHASDATRAVERLLHIGVEAHEFADATAAVVATRLVRTICPGCRAPCETSVDPPASLPVTPELLEGLGIDAANTRTWFHKGMGCAACGGTGVAGFTGVHEVLLVSERVTACLLKGAARGDLVREARREGFRTLAESASRQALLGVIPLDEARRVISDVG